MSKKKDYKLWLKGNDVYHFWAHQSQPEGKTTNVFFEGPVIYSYGRHFPMARIYTDKKDKKTVFFTTRSYSNTTSRHMSHTIRACRHIEILHMKIVPENDVKFGEINYQHKENIQDFCFDVKNQMEKFSTARKNKKWILHDINVSVSRLDKYITFFKIRTKIDAATRKLIAEAKSDKWQKEIIEFEKKEAERLADPKLQEKREKARLANEVRELRINAEQIEKWRNFEANRPYLQKKRRSYNSNSQPDLLRYNHATDRIQTSQGVWVPAESAHRFYRYIKVVLERGSCIGAENCQYQIVGYTVKEITNEQIRIGCHTIRMTEVEAMAVKMKWNDKEENKESIPAVSE